MKKVEDILKKEDYVKINFKVSSTQHLLVKTFLNGIMGTFILDTGASNSCVGLEFTDKFGLKTKSSKTQAAGAGAVGMFTLISKKNEIQLGKWKNKKINLVLFDMSHVNQALTQHKVETIDGIIGADILLKGKAFIDYNKRNLFLKK
jgi:predicted aspartyl protease